MEVAANPSSSKGGPGSPSILPVSGTTPRRGAADDLDVAYYTASISSGATCTSEPERKRRTTLHLRAVDYNRYSAATLPDRGPLPQQPIEGMAARTDVQRESASHTASSKTFVASIRRKPARSALRCLQSTANLRMRGGSSEPLLPVSLTSNRDA